jgi:DNA-binding PadR family transcriptional regulator
LKPFLGFVQDLLAFLLILTFAAGQCEYRRARFYTLTPAGRARLREETANWRRYARAVDAVLVGA